MWESAISKVVVYWRSLVKDADCDEGELGPAAIEDGKPLDNQRRDSHSLIEDV